ncbi:hypothetical protein [Mesorhizobium sp.]|uniref:hypothetical protein n=1 Tax=Mesorhizobium sp. TaxID=1871066 RepID=UPI00257D913E|nr:hypothetical protein [Mesorhizobium sp.]
MGRTLLVFSALRLPFAQAGAQEWQQFGIERFGFVFEVPPEFELLHRSKDGDGAAFQSPDGALLAVWAPTSPKATSCLRSRNRSVRTKKKAGNSSIGG